MRDFASPAMLPPELHSGSTAGLRQARKPHRRAIWALEGASFDALPLEHTEELLTRLRRGLHGLRARLEAHDH